MVDSDSAKITLRHGFRSRGVRIQPALGGQSCTGGDKGEAPDPSDNIRITPISAVTAEPVRWLWEGWWPLGAVSLMVGEPGCI